MNRRRSALAAAVLAVALVAGTFAVGELQGQAKPASADVAITTQVEKIFGRDPLLRSMHIRVDTQGGVVNLTGFVRSLEDIARAGEIARGVAGVSGVRNGLRLENRPSRA